MNTCSLLKYDWRKSVMRVAILVFSPTGNTLKVGKMLQKSLLARKMKVHIIDVTRDPVLYRVRKIGLYLKDRVRKHKLLCIGSPVYAHHLHYNVKDIIKSLPKPGNGWGQLAVPFVTYGGISSGVALQEAAKLLKRSGRIPVSGMKINSQHCLTKLKQISTKVNEGMPGAEAIPLIEELTEKIVQLDCIKDKDCVDISPNLRYQKLRDRIKAYLIFREKFWQNHFYPKLIFDYNQCSHCGKCSMVCPVQRIEMTEDGPIIPKGSPACIHCGSCVSYCPSNAINFDADWIKWNKLLKKAAEGRGPMPSNEHPKSVVYG